MLSPEQIYIRKLKEMMKKWRRTDPEENIRGIMQDFMFKQQLYTEIMRNCMLMCGEIDNENDFEENLESVFDLIYSLMKKGSLNISDAWRFVANTIRYGTERDLGEVIPDAGGALAAMRQTSRQRLGTIDSEMNPVDGNLLIRIQSL